MLNSFPSPSFDKTLKHERIIHFPHAPHFYSL